MWCFGKSSFDFTRPYFFRPDFELGDLGLVRNLEKFKTHYGADQSHLMPPLTQKNQKVICLLCVVPSWSSLVPFKLIFVHFSPKFT